MEYDKDKVDDATLALMYLVAFKFDQKLPGHSAWKSFDWDTLNRLHEKGLISDPHNKNKSINMSEDAFKKAEALFEEMFGTKE